jgi:hypothetical protein
LIRKRPEQVLQKQVVAYLRMACPDAITVHIPNGGYRSNIEAAILQGLGVLAGVADLMILWYPAKVAFIELKAPGESKRLSPAQVGFLCSLENMGIPNAVCDSLDAVRTKIKEWKVPCREQRYG